MFDFQKYVKLLDDCYNFNKSFAKELYPGDKDANIGNIGFLYDGPTDPTNWDKKKPKILFFAKERYGYWGCKPERIFDSEYDDYDITSISQFYKRIALISFLLSNYISSGKILSKTELKNCMKNRENLKSGWKNLAMIEAKKISGDDTYSHYNTIRFHAQKNKEFLKQQIQLLDPDIIFCCGGIVFTILTKDLELFNIEYDLPPDVMCHKINNKLIINSYHPSSLGNYFNLYHVYSEIVKNLPPQK